MFMQASRAANMREMDQLYDLFGSLFVTARDPATLDTHSHLVARRGRTDILAWLVHRGIDLDATNCVGHTCIHEAAAHGHIDTVVWLMDQGSNIFALNYKGMSALDLASQVNLDHATVLRTHVRRSHDSNQLWDDGDDLCDEAMPTIATKHCPLKQAQDLLVQALVQRNLTEPTVGLEILELHCPESLETVRRALDMTPMDVAVVMASNSKLILAHQARCTTDNQMDL
ncbi:hypothetical protein H310_00754 [Aphanomyces invadans]|uniref:Uncharacterized protein n=1 Tax=Aphanomyces invadans TaxID=157072 RepID=A0A024UVV0_9STRA|nr:hypothetical protein H310_00754 [Aphanomyces invadans]ETW10449.1 hypothetical protein H310_00754 [Aphanomyces invadans]|eukprot:XP_008861860.1 hypothetical protein H310_00754 [Aphanomyces invadans]